MENYPYVKAIETMDMLEWSQDCAKMIRNNMVFNTMNDDHYDNLYALQQGQAEKYETDL